MAEFQLHAIATYNSLGYIRIVSATPMAPLESLGITLKVKRF